MTYGQIAAKWLADVIWNNLPEALLNSVRRGDDSAKDYWDTLQKFEIRLAEVIDEILKENKSLKLRIDESGSPDKIIASVAKETNIYSISEFIFSVRKRICIDINGKHIVAIKGSIIRELL